MDSDRSWKDQGLRSGGVLSGRLGVGSWVQGGGVGRTDPDCRLGPGHVPVTEALFVELD